MPQQTFVPLPKEVPDKIWLEFGQTVLGKKMFEIVYDGRTDDDDGQTPDHEYHISSPMSLWLS